MSLLQTALKTQWNEPMVSESTLLSLQWLWRQGEEKKKEERRATENTGLRPERLRGKFVTALWRDKTEQFVSEDEIEAA